MIFRLLFTLTVLSAAGSLAAEVASPAPRSLSSSPEARLAMSELLLRALESPIVEAAEDHLPEHLQPCSVRFADLGRARYHRRTLIATLPDPVDSPFRRELDAFLLATVQAMSRLGLTSDLECLSWRLEASADTPDLHRRQPGVMLFRRDPSREKAEGEVVALLIVGETPGGGVHGEAMTAALNLATEEFAEATPADAAAHEAGVPADGAPDLKILGPTFSGSARSLASALRAWADRPLPDGASPRLRVEIRSGSATNTGLGQLFESSVANLEGRDLQVDFQAVPASNAELQSCVWNHLVPKRLGLRTRWEPEDQEAVFPPDHPCGVGGDNANDNANDNARVALLVESSAYGRQFVGNGFHVVPFSPYIGALRAAYERRRQDSARSGGDQTARQQALFATLPLDLALRGANRLAYDLEATVSSQDLVLTALLQELARRRTKVVGIIATNTLDKLFLAERMATFTPDARMITFEGDVLLAHPGRRGSTVGMIVASSQPLSDPEPLSTGRQAVQLRFDFDAAQGLYHALVDLLESEPRRRTRHAWFSVVGQSGFQFLERIALPPREGEAVETAPRPAPRADPRGAAVEAHVGGGGPGGGHLPRGWWLALTVVSLALAVTVLQVGRQWRGREPLFGLVPHDLVRPLRCREKVPDASKRTLHALVAVVPTALATPYLLLALPVLGPPVQEYSQADIGELGDLVTLHGIVVSLSSLCLGALILASSYLIFGLCLRTAWDVRGELITEAPRRKRRAASSLLPLSFVVAVTLLALGTTVYWIPRIWWDAENGNLLIERALALGGGVSPVLPYLLMASVPVSWIVLSLNRHRVSREMPRPSELGDAGRADRSYHRRLEELRQAIDPGALWQGARGRWVLLVVIPLVFLALFYGLPAEWPLRSMEGWVFDLTTSVLFTIALVMVVAAGISLMRGWAALRQLLDWIKGLQASLSGEDAKGEGSVALGHAYATASDSMTKAVQDREEAWKALETAMTDARAAGTEGPPKALADRLDHALVRRSSTSALVAVASWLEQTGGDAATAEAPKADASDAEKEKHATGRELVRRARSFFVWSTACFLRETRVQLVYLMVFMTAGLLVLLGSVTVYPFEPQRVVVLYLGILISLGAVLSAVVIVQWDRDRLLKSLVGDDVGGHWRTLAGRLGLFAGIPLVSLVASRFPAVRDVLGQWIEPLFKALM